jgi:ribosomal protein L37AE/L43A
MLDSVVMTEESSNRRHSCPSCGSESVRRSYRVGLIEKIFYRLIGLRPYRCTACETRFFDRGAAKGRKESSRD